MLSKRNLPLALLLLAICLIYSNFFGNSFHFDDFHTVTDNPAIRSLAQFPRFFTDTTAFSVLPANQTYRPVVTASLALDYALGRGYSPFWFHLSSLIWFLALTAVLYSFAESIFDRMQPGAGRSRWLAFLMAAWFGLHPAMAETVNYVIQRGDLYCTLGCLAALLFYVRWPSRRRYGFYLIPFVLAMLSKPPASVFPLLLLLYVFFFEESESSIVRRCRLAFVASLPAVVLTGLLLWLQSAMTPKSYAPTILSASAYRLTQPFVWLRYAGALFLPLHLNVDTDLQPMTTLTPAAIAGLLFALGLAVLIVYTARRPRLYPIAYGLLWFVITQLPTSLYTLSEVENDHRMFFSFPGLMIAVVWALYLGYERILSGQAKGSTRSFRQVATALCALVLCGYAYGAHRRNAVWHDETSLWADDVAKSPHNGRGLMIYGLTKMNAGDFPAALDLFNRALLYTPNYATLEVNLGVVTGLLADTGKPAYRAEAEAHFQRAISLSPNDDLTHAYYGRWLLAHGQLAQATAQLEAAVALNGQRQMQRDLLLEAYTQAGNTAAAQSLAQSTLAMIPGDASAFSVLHGQAPGGTASPAATLINVSLAAYRAGKFEESIAAAQEALKADPHSAEAWNNIGAGYGALHEWDLGIAAEQQALKLNSQLTIASNNLRWFLQQKAMGGGSAAPAVAPETKSPADLINLSLALNQSGHYRESIEAAQKALALDPASAEAWNNIAADDEAMGRWDDAIEAARKAIALRPDFQLARNNLAWSLQQKSVGGKH
ncbi:MAG TPA: tetratricopeptide repeat protein [Acidobacteriaceae bacterium]|nr:tetratricopeptide repeat protein [Acidobacteriaceae bacterium]